MKKLTALLAGAILMMAAGSAWAIPTLDGGYSWVNSPLWTNTDHTTPPAQGNSQFEIKLENASYESDFGLFTVNNNLTPTLITNSFQVFSYLDEVDAIKTVKFKQTTPELFQVSLDGSNWTDFSNSFGFYFGVHTGGASDSTTDYSYYTFNQFNTPNSEIGVNHILLAYNSSDALLKIYLDDQILTGADRDYNDMVVRGNDLAPVPEPGTMVLLGFGMFGLAIYGKRRMNNNQA